MRGRIRNLSEVFIRNWKKRLLKRRVVVLWLVWGALKLWRSIKESE